LFSTGCQQAPETSTNASAEGAAADDKQATKANDSAKPGAQVKGDASAACDVELAVDGMTCTGCVSAITKSLELLEDVKTAKVDLEKQRAFVQAQGPLCNPDGAKPMLEAIADLGYSAKLRDVK